MAKNIELYHANGTSFELVYPKTDWSLIINKPSTFTPTSHTHSAEEIEIPIKTVGSNTAVGRYTLLYNTGYNNTAIGYAALRDNTTGYNNTAIGYAALRDNTTGCNNTAIGIFSLQSNTTGYNNTAIGIFSLQSNTTGYYNTAIGDIAFNNNTTGYQNVAIGHWAGRYIADGATGAETTKNSVLIGALTKVQADDQTNQIVIGYNATGKGSNTVVLGNDSINATYLKGVVYGDTFKNQSGVEVSFSGHTHSASNITSGTFSTARIPSLDASKITTGIFGIGRIPATDSRDGGGYGAVLYAEAMYQHTISSDHDNRYLRPSIFSLDGTTLTITT